MDRITETVVVTRESVVGYAYLQEPAVEPPMGGWPENFPTEPMVTGTPKVIYDVVMALDRCEEVQHRALFVKGEQVGWIPIGLQYYELEALYKVGAGKRASWPVECYRLVPVEG